MTAPARNSRTHGTAWHAPVLVHEVCEAFKGRDTVLDGTLGGGGHAEALLEYGHHVVGVDRDATALAEPRARLLIPARHRARYAYGRDRGADRGRCAE